MKGMQRLYNTSFRSANHSPLPQFVMHGNAIYAHPANAAQGTRMMPWYEMRGNKFYTTASNPSGHSAKPMYEVRGNKVYATVHNTAEHSHLPVFQIKD